MMPKALREADTLSDVIPTETVKLTFPYVTLGLGASLTCFGFVLAFLVTFLFLVSPDLDFVVSALLFWVSEVLASLTVEFSPEEVPVSAGFASEFPVSAVPALSSAVVPSSEVLFPSSEDWLVSPLSSLGVLLIV